VNPLCGPLAIKEARPKAMRAYLWQTARQITFFWGFFLFVVPAAITWAENSFGFAHLRFDSPWIRGAGIAVFALASVLGLWSGFIMATRGDGTPLPAACAKKLVLEGPYRYVRNPMALAGIAQGVGVALFLGSPIVLAYAIAGAFVWNNIARPIEERDLVARFGQPYHRYREQVRCWIPRLRPYDSD
jgi:protein-S-isoprenylcysteine O-methyltransferase Ste14